MIQGLSGDEDSPISILGAPKNSTVETWLKGTPTTPLQSELQTGTKRKFTVDDEKPCFSLNEQLSKPSQSTTPLTKEALHKIDKVYSSESTSSGSMPTSASDGQSAAASSSAISPYNDNYEDHIGRRGVMFLPQSSDQYPSNWTTLREVLLQPRDSPEPSPAMHTEFDRNITTALNEKRTLSVIIADFLKVEWQRDGQTVIQEDSAWKHHVPLYPGLEPRLTAPQPDVAYAWSTQSTFNAFAQLLLSKEVQFKRTKKNTEEVFTETRTFATPSPMLAWPLFTVEGKGSKGASSIANKQNMDNGSIMVNNILQLKRKIGQEMGFYDRALVLTLDATDVYLQLNIHWASLAVNGEVTYLMRQLESWNPRQIGPDQYRAACKGIRNAVEYIRRTAFSEIQADVQTLINMPVPLSPPDLDPPKGRNIPLPQQAPKSGEQSACDSDLHKPSNKRPRSGAGGS